MKRTISILLIFLLLLTACGADGPTWKEQYDLGIRHLSEGSYEEAILAFKAAIAIDPKQADAYIGLAAAYVATDRRDEAVSILRDALDKVDDPSKVETRLQELSAAQEDAPDPEPEDEPEKQPEPEKEPVYTVTYEDKYDDNSNHWAVITGYADGKEIWVHSTEPAMEAQSPKLHDIGFWQDRYYYCNDHAVIALDAKTGAELWRNGDFNSTIAAFPLIGPDGTVYLTGAWGPDLYAVSAEGKTLCRIERLSEVYKDPIFVSVDDTTLIVGMHTYGNEYVYETPYLRYLVNTSTFEYMAEGMTPGDHSMFDETYWGIMTGVSMGGQYVALFHDDGTFHAQCAGSGEFTQGSYRFTPEGKLYITLAYAGLQEEEFVIVDNGFESTALHEMQTLMGNYSITPHDFGDQQWKDQFDTGYRTYLG